MVMSDNIVAGLKDVNLEQHLGVANWDMFFLLLFVVILSILGVSLEMMGLMGLLRYAMRDM